MRVKEIKGGVDVCACNPYTYIRILYNYVQACMQLYNIQDASYYYKYDQEYIKRSIQLPYTLHSIYFGPAAVAM